MNDKRKRLEEMNLAKLVSLANGTTSKAIAQNADETALPNHQNLTCSRIDVPWSHIKLSLAGPIRRTSYLILVDSQWPEVKTVKFEITHTVINSLREVFVAPEILKIMMSRNITQFSFTLFGDIFS
ncbi:unnamed protein product [Hymenolepis diminuta]|uniref:Uncharacterized protein n=1 Tax=Hymenolepis diminuta TaxID=6216 RepID=A0A0R3SJK1_HYMDI|nr:unnamed protein product [Hymenolepis diminuta]